MRSGPPWTGDSRSRQLCTTTTPRQGLRGADPAGRPPRPGLGLAYNGAAGILGGTTPLVCATLVELSGSKLAPGAYVAFACLVSLLVALRTGETGGAPLR
jgi:hypothetical protein